MWVQLGCSLGIAVDEDGFTQYAHAPEVVEVDAELGARLIADFWAVEAEAPPAPEPTPAPEQHAKRGRPPRQ